MTQIAATIATMTHKTPPTGKAPATAGGGGMDFSAIVAGLASGDTVAPDGEVITSDDANAETGQELPAEGNKDQTPGQPVVQDLALTAAAQSAMADMVVSQPALPVAMQAVPEGTRATDAIAMDGGARPSWRMAKADRIPLADTPAVLAAETPTPSERRAPSTVATSVITKPLAAVVTDSVAPVPPTQASPADTRAIDPAATPTEAVPAMSAAIPAAPQKAPAAPRATTSARAEAAAPVAHLLRQIAAEMPKAETPPSQASRAGTIAPSPVATPAVETAAAVVVPAGSMPAMTATPASPPSSEPGPTAPVTRAAPSTTAEMPLASITADMLRRRPDMTVRPAASAPVAATPVTAPASDTLAPVMAQQGESAAPSQAAPRRNGATAQPAEGAAPDTPATVANRSTATPMSTALPLLSPTPSNQSVATPAPVAQIPAQLETAIPSPLAVPDGGGEEAVAAATPTAPTIRPVMSALHRVAATADPSIAVAAPSAGDSGAKRQDGDTAPDHAPPGPAAPNAADPVTTSTPAPRAYADIVQSLPPVAQNAIGAVGNAAAVPSAPDVGVTLENRVIDMSIGGQWIDRVAQEITQLAQGTGHSRFQLSPPNLGRIQIDIRQAEGGGSHVQMLTETSEAAQRLRDGQSSLQSDARIAALSLGTIAISHAASAFDMANDQGSSRQPSGDPNAQAFNQGNQSGQGGQSGHQGNQPQHQPNQSGQAASGGQLSQNGGQNAPQQGQQATPDGNSNGQGKSSLRGDVLEGGAGNAMQEGTPARGTSDRLVRYA